MKGPLIILSGPSGCGKSTVTARLLKRSTRPLRQAISATTRARRAGEKEGVHYYFWDREQFDHEVAGGAFLEWAEVHGSFYGTLRREVEGAREQGIGVVLVIDVQGAAQVRQRCPDALSVFLRTSHWDELERRLRSRGTESEEKIRRRLENARRELERADEYDHQVVNDDLDAAVEELNDLIEAQYERASSR